jgi:hypothetical protein
MSTRSIKAAGISLRSETLLPLPVPGPRRRPLMRTRVRWGPKPRRLTVAVPSAPFDTVEFWPANTMGKLLRMSSTRVRLVEPMYPASTLVIGLIAVRIGDVILEPVTTTSSSPGSGAVETAALLTVTVL